ncbi:hypothetical protein [Chthonobacter rhizosphaerae]|uniref:hypothetical protein n=1 Tax=Chthonobacter rhizosphaerae TaxID=2735553 RepID=UPI0015EEC6B8|nr:hypothetical protein [Chthonobacter rhizosphaerae]
MADPWMLAFGTEVNEGHNSGSVNAANGIGNSVTGEIVSDASQTVVDYGHDFGFEAHEANYGSNSADVYAANGLFNHVGGGIYADADQTVGDVEGFPLFMH